MTKGLMRIVTAGVLALAMAVAPVSAAFAAPRHHPREQGNTSEVLNAVQCAGDVFFPGAGFVIGISVYAVQHDPQLWHVAQVLRTGGELSSDDINNLLAADVDGIWLGIGTLADFIPGLDCVQLAVQLGVDLAKQVQDEATKKYPPQSTLDLNGVDLGNPDLSGALNNSGNVDPTTQTPNSSDALTTPEGASSAPTTSPAPVQGPPCTMDTPNGPATGWLQPDGSCYLGTAM